MSTYDVGGKGHRILSRLEEGEAVAAELLDAAVGEAADRRRRNKAWFALRSLVRDGMAEVTAGFYRITQDGRDALTCLRSGRPVTVAVAAPSVRVFGRAAA